MLLACGGIIQHAEASYNNVLACVGSMWCGSIGTKIQVWDFGWLVFFVVRGGLEMGFLSFF